MRKYAIFYKRGTGTEFASLNQSDHTKLIDHEEVREAIELMRQRPFLVGTCVQVDDELFNIISLHQKTITVNAFTFAP